MNNPFFSAMGNVGNGMNVMSMLTQLKSNPMALLKQAGFNVPNDVSNPQSIIQYLMNSGQVSQQQVNNAQAMAQTFGIK